MADPWLYWTAGQIAAAIGAPLANVRQNWPLSGLLPSLPRRCRKNLLHRPAFEVAPDDGPRSQTRLFTPGGNRHRSALKRQHEARSLIPSLLVRSCPPAVRWLVVPVDVDSVDTMLRGWARPHVAVEDREVRPLRTDGDATPAIVSELPITPVETPVAQVVPDPVLGRSIRVSVLRVPRAGDLRSALALPTAAGQRVALPQTTAGNRFDGAAVTSATKADIARPSAFRVLFEDGKPAKLRASRDGNLVRHRDLPLSRNRGARPRLLTQVRGLSVAVIIP